MPRRLEGRSRLYHFTVHTRPVESRGLDETANPGASYPAYMFDLRSGGSVARSAVAVCPAVRIDGPAKASRRRDRSRGVAAQAGNRRSSWSASIVAAHGDSAGALDDVMPGDTQQKLVRATKHGFFIIHIGKGKAAFATLESHRDVDSQLSYLAQWV